MQKEASTILWGLSWSQSLPPAAVLYLYGISVAVLQLHFPNSLSYIVLVYHRPQKTFCTGLGHWVASSSHLSLCAQEVAAGATEHQCSPRRLFLLCWLTWSAGRQRLVLPTFPLEPLSVSHTPRLGAYLAPWWIHHLLVRPPEPSKLEAVRN